MRQTGKIGSKDYLLPDGFNLSISVDSGTTWVDVGILKGGAKLTLNWDDVQYDAGNYEDLGTKANNLSLNVAPSEVMNFNPAAIAALWPGLATNSTATEPTAGTKTEFGGSDRMLNRTRGWIRLRHYVSDNSDGGALDTDVDWEAIIKHALTEAGGTFTFNGIDSTDLDTLSVSFKATPDPADSYKFFSFFSTFTEA